MGLTFGKVLLTIGVVAGVEQKFKGKVSEPYGTELGRRQKEAQDEAGRVDEERLAEEARIAAARAPEDAGTGENAGSNGGGGGVSCIIC